MQRTIRSLGAALGVKSGEGIVFCLLLLINMLIGIGRNFSWTAANALFLDRFGSANQPYLFLLNSVLVPTLAAVYLRIEQRLPFRSLSLLSLAALVAFLTGLRFLLWSSSAGWITFLAAVSADIVQFLTNVVFWTLAGKLCDVRQAKRLFPMIGTGEWIMMVIGGFATPWIVSLIGTENLFWLAAAGTAAALFVFDYVLRRHGSADEDAMTAESESAAKTSSNSILSNPYVAFMLLNNVLATFGLFFLDNALYGLIEQRYTDADQLANFLAVYWAWVAIVILVSRGILTSRLLSTYGVNIGLLALPVSVLIGVIAFSAVGTTIGIEAALPFWLLAMTRFSDACLRNDLNESAAIILYQPLPPVQRSVVQATNDGVFVPLATGLSGAVLLLLKKGFGFGPLEIVYTIPLIVVPWILSGFSVTRRYPAMLAAAIAGHRFDAVTLSLSDNTSLEMLKSRLASPHATEVLYALALLEESGTEELPVQELSSLLSRPEAEIRREVLRVIARHDLTSLIPAVRTGLAHDECAAVRGEALLTLARLEEVDALDELTPFLQDSDPNLRVAALVGLMRYVGMEGIVLAAHYFEEMRISNDPAERQLAARILGDVGIENFYRPLLPLLSDRNTEVRYESLISAGKLKNPRLWPDVLTALDLPSLQSAAVSALVSGGESVLPLLESAFEKNLHAPEFQIRLIRVFQQIRGDGVMAFLERHIDVTHPDVYSRVLGALNICRYHASSTDASRVSEKIRVECQHTAWLLSVLNSLSDDEAYSLLKAALDDLRHQDRDRVFLLLSFLYDARSMLDSRNNLEHPSAARRAYAIEIVDTSISRDLKPYVLPLLDDLSLFERERRLALAAGVAMTPQSVSAHLSEIIAGSEQRVTDWLVACAIFAAAKLRLRECLGAVTQAVIIHRNPLVRHTGVWAMSQIDPLSYRQQIARLLADDISLQAAVSILEQRELGAQLMLLDIEKLLILKTVPIFVEAPDHVLAQVVSILEEQEFAAAETIFEKGDLGTCMYVIVSGKVRVHDEDRELVVLGERQVFGELALLDPEPRSASVTAVEPTLVFRISQAAIYELMANHIEIVRGIMRVLCRRIRQK